MSHSEKDINTNIINATISSNIQEIVQQMELSSEKGAIII